MADRLEGGLHGLALLLPSFFLPQNCQVSLFSPCMTARGLRHRLDVTQIRTGWSKAHKGNEKHNQPKPVIWHCVAQDNGKLTASVTLSCHSI